MRPSCLSLRRRSSAKWRRWTDPQARLCTRRGPRQGRGWPHRTGKAAPCEVQTCGFSRAARDCLPVATPLRSICVQVSRGPAAWSHRCLSCCRQGGGRPLLHSTTLRVRPASREQAQRGCLADPPQRVPAANHGPTPWRLPQGSASPSRDCPPCPTPVRAGSGPGLRGPLGVSKLYMSPSAFNTAVSCLPLCGSGDGAPQCPLSTLISTAPAQRVPGSSFVRPM